MSVEFSQTTSGEFFSTTYDEEQGREADETFEWGFNLNDIDPELIFDESMANDGQDGTEEEPIGERLKEEGAPTFDEWLNSTVPEEETLLTDQVPHAFRWAENESAKTSKRMANVNFDGLNAIGGALGSLLSIIGACGPVCLHALGSVASAGSTGLSITTPGLGGLNMPGFNVDKDGNFRLSGNINSLSQATGLSREALLSGKYSAQDILTSFFSILGDAMCSIFGFGLIDCLIDGLIPLPKAA